MKIRLGTRKSNLAVTQTESVAQLLRAHYPEIEIEIVKLSTKGDEVLHKPIGQVGSKGVFVKEIEQALLDRKIDLAVHSMKDMPGDVTPGLCFVNPPEGADPRDVLVAKEGLDLSKKDQAFRFGTGSLRRALQLKLLFPHCETVPIRGNIETRMSKIESENLDGVVLAYAGLQRGGYTGRVHSIFSGLDIIPAPCQGILALQIREDDQDLKDLLAPLTHEDTLIRYETERAFQGALDGSCQTPMGIFTSVQGDQMTLIGCFGSEDGQIFVRRGISGFLKDRQALAQTLARELKEEVDEKRTC